MYLIKLCLSLTTKYNKTGNPSHKFVLLIVRTVYLLVRSFYLLLLDSISEVNNIF